MAPEAQITSPESKAEAEALIPKFELTNVLNQDQNGRRISLLGQIQEKPALLVLERAAFPSQSGILRDFLTSLTHTTNLGANDVYRWYMSNTTSSPSAAAVQRVNSGLQQDTDESTNAESTPTTEQKLHNVKVNLIWPATPQHIKKYTSQPVRYVTETSEIYKAFTRPLIQRTQRTQKRLDWIYNVLDGRTEQEDVVHRSVGLGICTKEDKSDSEGFLLLPDLNWDRRTVTGMHLLALVERRDLWSVRDLKKRDVPWLKTLREEIVDAAAGVAQGLASAGGDAVGKDEFKCYVHYHPTYWHFHVHVVHVMLEAEGGTQSVGKAVGLENVISWLESMPEEKAMEDVDLSFYVGVESEIWKEVFLSLKEGKTPTIS